MGLYLAVFDGDMEVDGVEVGSYADFDAFRSAIAVHVEQGVAGSRCPTLMLHSDCDGEWVPDEMLALRSELVVITEVLMELPPQPLPAGWQSETARTLGLSPLNLKDCFFDVDGESLTDRLMGLVEIGIERRLPILFQ